MIRIPLAMTAAALALACLLSAPARTQEQRYDGLEGLDVRDGYGSGLPDDVVVQFDPETGSLIVITDEATNEQLKRVVESLDRPVPQVLIKVLFLEVTHSDGLDLGVEFALSDIDRQRTYAITDEDGDGVPEVGFNTEVVREEMGETLFGLAGETAGGFYRLIKNDVEVTVRALSQVAELEVLSRPSILARNNQEAVITVGQEVPFIRNTRILQDGQQLNTVEYEDIGIILRVTPQIRQDGLVAMNVIPEISTLTGETVPISDTVSAPVFAKRSAETGVVVPNGETVVIGGLMEDQETKSVRKVPLLGDVPLLGALFRRTITEKAKTELLIFLTPYVVPDPSGLAALTRSEQRRARITPKAFTPEQLGDAAGGWPADVETDAAEPAQQRDTPAPGAGNGNGGLIFSDPDQGE